ncbi:MAG: rod shape-determining protein MreC [Tidjanibacter sp.]|nr:rod shape-determining protein MreC [Tidjanibacter sp.]
MYKLVRFFKSIAVPLLFIVLEALAVTFYARSTSYSRARLLTASNVVVGRMNRSVRQVVEYFGLRSENGRLLSRIEALENDLAHYVADNNYRPLIADELSPYTFLAAKVIDNSIYRQENFIVLDKGQRDGVETNMAVLTPEGCVAGYVVDCSDRFAVAMSIANRKFTMGGRIKNTDYIGSVVWNGGSHRTVDLTSIPHYAAISKGDTLLSTTSYRFPPDRMIGIVESVRPMPDKMSCEIEVRLAADLASLRNVVLVKYSDSKELEELQHKYSNR